MRAASEELAVISLAEMLAQTPAVEVAVEHTTPPTTKVEMVALELLYFAMKRFQFMLKPTSLRLFQMVDQHLQIMFINIQQMAQHGARK
jgi:hypothetical protein